MPDLKQALRDFVATSNSGKYPDERTLLSKFPELKGYDINALRDFVATANSGKYQNEEQLFSKFPEFRTSAPLAPAAPAQTAPVEEVKKKAPAQTTMESTSEDSSLDLQQPPKPKGGILSQPVPKNTTESFLATVSAAPSAKPQPIDFTPKEKDYFTGDFGKALKAIDAYSPIAIGDYVDDMGRAIASGYEAGKVVTPANELMIRDKKATAEQIKKYVQAAKEMEGLGPSQEMIDFTKTYEDEGKGVWGLIKGLAFNPTVVPQVMVNSITMMLNPTSLATIGGVVGGSAAVGAALSPYVAGAGAAPAAIGSIPYAFGAASATLESGLTFSELLKEELDKKGLDFNEANVKKILEDDKLVSSIRGRSIARGAAIGTVDALTGRLAGKVGAKLLTGTAASRVKAGLAAAAIESVGGSAGESLGRLAAGQEQDVAEIGLEGIAEGPMAIPSLAAEVLNKPVYKIDGKRVSEIDVKEIVENTPAPDLAKINFEFKNDRSKWANKIQDKVVTHSTKEQVREANPELNEPSLDAITKLELDLQKLQGNTTQSGKDKAAAIRGQIKGIQENQLQEEAAQQNELGSAYRSQRISDIEKALAQPESKDGTVTIDDKQVTRAEAQKELETLKTEKAATPTQVVTLEESAQQRALGNAYRSQRISDVETALAQPENESGTVTINDKVIPRTELETELETLKAEQDAIQKQTTSQVPVQSEAGTRLQVAEGEPKAEPQVPAQEVEIEEVDRFLDSTDQETFNKLTELKQPNLTTAVNEIEALNLPLEENNRRIAEVNQQFKEEATQTISEAYSKAKQDGSNPELVLALESLVKENTAKKMQQVADAFAGITRESVQAEQAAQQSATDNQAQVETLRAQEQNELMEAIPNADNYVVDGKVDRTKISDPNDLKTFDKIYDKYDKLITPLLATTEVSSKTPTTQTQQNEQAPSTTPTSGPVAGNRLFNNPLSTVSDIAKRYYKRVFKQDKPDYYGSRQFDEARAKRISDAFIAMQHEPNNPQVKKAYEALAKETLEQYKAFLEAGYRVEINNEEPYANSQEMIDDLRNNKRIKIFSTESGFGDNPITAKQRKENPLLKPSGYKDVNGQPLLINDAFRAIHDFFGHAELGNSFGFKGEENAWNVHARMFSPLARRAMTTETRGQNSYVNFSGVNQEIDAMREQARQLRAEGKEKEAQAIAEKIYELGSFADQKIGLLPEEFSEVDVNDIGDVNLQPQGLQSRDVEAAPVAEQAPVQEVTVEEEEQYEPITVRDIDHDTFTRDNASDYEEDERDGDNGRSYTYLSSITVPIMNQDGDTIGYLVKMSDGDGELTFDAEDENGSRISKNDEGYFTLGDAKKAFVEAYNKTKQKEFDKQAKAKTKQKAKQAEKDTAKAAKAAAKKGAAKVEEVQAIVDDLLSLDENDKSTAQKVSDVLGKVIQDIEKFEKTSLGVNVALPIIKGVIQAVKALVDAGISLQKAIKQVAQDNNITEQQVKDNINIVPILNGFNELMTSVDKLIARQKSKEITDAKIVTNIDTFVRNSEVYQSANDAQKKILEKEARAKMGVDERRAPSIGRVLGALKDFTNISRQEKIQIIRQIKNLSQDAAKSLAKEIKEMANVGKITVNQAANIIAKFGKVNMLSEASVGSFVDYMAKVFNNAEYAQKIDVIKKQLSNAKKNIATKIGIADGLMIPLQKLFAINPTLIPDAVFDEYAALVDMFGKREAVLSLAEKSRVQAQVQNILNAINAEQSQVIDLAARLENFDNKVYNQDGTIDYAATLNKMTTDEVISEDEAEVMRKYKSDILPQAETAKKTEAEIEAEKKELIKEILNTTTAANLPSRNERELAVEFLRLRRTAAIYDLSVAELKNIIKLVENIRNGYLPHYAQVMVERLNSINNAKELTNAVNQAKPLSLTEAYAKIKSLLTGKSAILEMIRRNPLANIDQVFGNFKTKEIFNTLLKKASEASSAFQTDLKKVQNILENAENKVAKSFKLDPNKTLMSKFKMMTYLIQLEFNSNPDNKQVNKASDFLKATIKHIENGKSRFGERDAEMLSKILSDYADSNGNIDINKLYNSFNEAEKSAIKDIQSVNQSLAGKAEFTASVIRGQKFNPLNNYVHLNVLNEAEPTDLTMGTSFATEYNNSMRPSTKAKSLIERTGKVSPLNFDVFASAQRGAKFVLMDYNLTEPIRTARKTLNQTEANLEAETGKMSKKDRDVFNAIRDAFEESVENLLTNAVVSNSLADDVVDYINKQGYRAILAGTGRFISELSSNIGFALISDPKAFTTGYNNRGFIMSADAPLVMQNVKSKQTSRIFPTDTLSGRAIDTSILSQAGGIVGGTAKNSIANKIQQIWNLSGKKYGNFVELTADALISTPDKIVMRPLWFGSFANNFKAITGKDVDFEKIAANDEEYMNRNQQAIEQAKTIADERSVMAGATDNAFMGVLKGTIKPNQSFTTRAFNNFNNFMTKFLIFEYVTARTGIMAAMGNGSMTKKQGAATLAAVTTRMLVYTLLGQMLGNGLMGMFYDDDEPEDDKSFLQKAGQAIASTFTSLMFGRDFGNATKAIVNAGIETINEKYFDFLREGDYDPYKDAIQFSVIPKERKGKQNDLGDLLMNMGGAFGPSLKTANFLYIKATEDEKKKADAIERQEKERNIRVPLEIIGNAGYIPLYKDVRKLVMKNLYSDLANAESNLANKKMAEKEKLQGYETEGDMKRYDPDMWNETFGPSSEGYDEREAKKNIKREEQRMKRAIKDEEYNYTPKADADGFGSKKGFSDSKSKSRSRSKSDGFGSKDGFSN